MPDSRLPDPPGQSLSSATEERGWPLFNLPNLITTLRIFLIPVFLVLFINPSPARAGWAALVFVLASATDLLDGYIARKMEQITRLGKILDPIADKLLIISALILLVQFQRVSAILAILIIGREMAVTALRAIASDQGIVISAEKLGKLKTFLQTVSITLLIFDPSFFPQVDLHFWGLAILWLSLILAMISAWNYFHSFIKRIYHKY